MSAEFRFIRKSIRKNYNVTELSAPKEFLSLSIKLFFVLMIIYLAFGYLAEIIFERIDPEYEKQMERLIFIEESAPPEKEIQDKLSHSKELLQRLCENTTFCSKTPRLSVSDKIRDKNALALPNSHILLSKELLDDIRSDNELAFILTHELGHYKNRDHIKRFGRMAVIIPIVTVLASEGEIAANLFFWCANLDVLSYSRMQEREADQFAVDLVYKLYGNVDGAASWLERNDKTKGLRWFSTHPKKNDRLSFIKEITSGHDQRALNKGQ